MLAVDTDVVVRYLTRDDAEQFAKVNALIGGEDVYVCTTVLLETVWVLRRAYRFSRERVVDALAPLPVCRGSHWRTPPRLSRHSTGRSAA